MIRSTKSFFKDQVTVDETEWLSLCGTSIGIDVKHLLEIGQISSPLRFKDEKLVEMITYDPFFEMYLRSGLLDNTTVDFFTQNEKPQWMLKALEIGSKQHNLKYGEAYVLPKKGQRKKSKKRTTNSKRGNSSKK